MGGSKRGINIFAGVILSAFTLAAVYFIVSILNGLEKGPVRAEDDFEYITETLNSALFFNMDAESAKEFQNKALSNPRIAALLISSGKNVLFAYPSVSPLIALDDTGTPSVKTASPFIKIFSTSLPRTAGINTVLTAAVYTLQPEDIYYPARLSFMIILCCTLTVFIVLICLEKKAASERNGKMSDKADTDFSSDFENVPTENTEAQNIQTDGNADFDFSEADILTGYDFEQFNSKYGFDSTPADDFSLQTDFSEAADTAGTEKKSDFEEEQVRRPEAEEPAFENSTMGYIEESTDRIDDPAGLFSPATGVGWESYMEPRLDSELVRAASSEQDLALVLLRIEGIENNMLMLKKTAAVLLDFFKFKDFVFEYKKDGFAGILLNINLDQTMILAESMYTQLKDLLESENIHNKLAMGLSTRTLRLIPGSRLITEADRALQKAVDETDMPIVAFRANPDKYRQYVADSYQI